MRKIIHCDCDCFYAAVEMRDDPSLVNIPIAIGGSSDRRGVISTCNYPAREFGIHSAMATALALKRCPQLHLISGNMQKYKDASKQIFDIYREITPLLEPLSLDEAFLDVSRVDRYRGSATRIAEYLRYRVEKEVGITISAGVAPNKFLAKIASDWNKPNGLKVVTPDGIASFVEHLPVNKIPGVGKKTAEKMRLLGIETCEHVRAKGDDFLQQHFGMFGARIFQLSQGIDDRVVSNQRDTKSVSVEHTFAIDIDSCHSCLEQISMLQQELHRRYQNLKQPRTVSGLFVKLKFCDFTQTTVEQQASISQQSLFKDMLVQAYQRGAKPVRLIGLGYRLMKISDRNYQQLILPI
ncbi:MAG: DNA polymerase IV [Oceanospirillaceae bacterium]|nr:DNA polymerase IV [Oceanospirillaceae bacterium]